MPQMLREPVGGGGCSAQELVGVGREVAAGVELQPLRLASAGERSQGEVGGADDVGVANHHEERVGAMRSMNAPGSYPELHLERPQRDLVAPLLKPPLVLLGRVLAGKEVPCRHGLHFCRKT